VPLLKCTDTGQKAINIMETFRISHLPLVNNSEYLGLISDRDIYDLGLEMCKLEAKNNTLPHPFVRANQHLYEVAQKMLEQNISVIPVLEQNDNYIGLITINDLASKIADLFLVKEPGAVIVLEINNADYSLSQIAQIVESNDVKILSLYTRHIENTSQMHISLKLNITDASAVIQTFVRYDYNIAAVYMDDSLLHDMYTERFDLFMKYLNL
jgi:predicted transcriptional regulator